MDAREVVIHEVERDRPPLRRQGNRGDGLPRAGLLCGGLRLRSDADRERALYGPPATRSLLRVCADDRDEARGLTRCGHEATDGLKPRGSPMKFSS